MKKLASIVLVLLSGCNFVPAGGESDVPCADTPEWLDITTFAIRHESPGSAILLMTCQSESQASLDSSDGSRDYTPHLAVYRFDPALDAINKVEEAAWLAATGAIQECCSSLLPLEPFTQIGTDLYFDGRRVEVAGGKVLKTSDAPHSPVLAVLSTNGQVSRFLPKASGQHFHQLFSRVDGQPLGAAIKLGLGGLENGVVFFEWMNDESYLVYEQSIGTDGGIGRICIVPVTEPLPGSFQEN